MRRVVRMTDRWAPAPGLWRWVGDGFARTTRDALHAQLGMLGRRLRRFAPVAFVLFPIGRAGQLAAQEARGAITGTIREAESAEPLAGVEIRVVGRALMTVTGEAGRFRDRKSVV